MSVYDEGEHPWLAAEKRLIADEVRAGTPYWGACLGVQLLAASLGAPVYAGPKPEVGLLPVRLTEEGLDDPVLRGLPAEFVTLQWHGDTFDLPEGGVALATSPAYPRQAFRYGKAYWVQFHLEVSREMVMAWAEVPAYAESLDRMLGPGALPRLIDELDGLGPEMLDHGRRLFESFIDATVGVAR